MAALRAELAALRTNLEVLFDADLSGRPALESDRPSPLPDWTEDTATIPPVPGRVESSRITPVSSAEPEAADESPESPIIDVPEELSGRPPSPPEEPGPGAAAWELSPARRKPSAEVPS